jgi:hypothetical protein
MLRTRLKEFHPDRESSVIQSKPIRSVTEVVDLNDTEGDMLVGHDIKAAAELTRPTVVSSPNAMDVTASEQSVSEWFEPARVFGEAGSHQVSKDAARDSTYVLGREH